VCRILLPQRNPNWAAQNPRLGRGLDIAGLVTGSVFTFTD